MNLFHLFQVHPFSIYVHLYTYNPITLCVSVHGWIWANIDYWSCREQLNCGLIKWPSVSFHLTTVKWIRDVINFMLQPRWFYDAVKETGGLAVLSEWTIRHCNTKVITPCLNVADWSMPIKGDNWKWEWLAITKIQGVSQTYWWMLLLCFTLFNLVNMFNDWSDRAVHEAENHAGQWNVAFLVKHNITLA